MINRWWKLPEAKQVLADVTLYGCIIYDACYDVTM